jgi:hypothetical protein
MKGEAVSAVREGGLDLAVRDADPRVNESINSVERKTDIMKTYILRDLKAVEPQKSARLSRSELKDAALFRSAVLEVKWISSMGAETLGKS